MSPVAGGPLEVGPDICPDCGSLWSHTPRCVNTRLGERDRLRKQIARIFRDRHEPDKVTAYCLEVCPDLAQTATSSREERDA